MLIALTVMIVCLVCLIFVGRTMHAAVPEPDEEYKYVLLQQDRIGD